ncbi:hypothetical protein ACFTAO_02885 [Paenibacillus rhizoplanae]
MPELPRTDHPGRIGSLSVVEGHLTERWEDIPKITPNLGIAAHEVMFMVKGTAIFFHTERQYHYSLSSSRRRSG